MIKPHCNLKSIQIPLRVAIFSTLLLFGLVPPALTYAQPSQAAVGVSSTQSTSAKTAAEARVAANKEKACMNRITAINAIIGRINTRAENQITLFNTIATRVEAFYVTKGKTAPTYDQLVAAIATAKTQANTDLSSMTSIGTINCTSPSPKTEIETFRTDLKTEITDLQTFRTSVKNLIVAVAKAQGATLNPTSTTAGGQ